MHKSRQAIDQQQAALMEYNGPAGKRSFSFKEKKQKKPGKFTEINAAVKKFKVKVFRTLKIPQKAEWLSKWLK